MQECRVQTLTRKQREIKDREVLVLNVARRMLVEYGYLGLSMDAIASELEYSKGTIYNHFPCKEEIIIALAIQTMDQRTDMFVRAASEGGPPRQRLSGIGVAAELFVRLYPDHFGVEQLIRAASIWEKTSENRRRLMHAAESRCMGIVAGIVRDGIARGDLSLPDELTPEDLVFGLWSQTFGAYSIIATSDGLEDHGVVDPYRAVRQTINRTLDGYQWTPLSTDYNYMDLFERQMAEVFPDEYQQISF
jgi:AcrR family transcriptional regulator